MRKVDDGEKQGGKKKSMMEIVATYVITSRPPEQQPTALPTARANYVISLLARLVWDLAFLSQVPPFPP